ncbi:hypothetical protein JNB91_20415 [Rhizobium wenxiniae]|uniref:hypothetical protein n=1 Tax=Rhizobium wenxiniae TaxID=1737357 RepID=UPI001C6EC0F2|nr:hypothetical protein [Rhizobium wenxiniae]MBW9090176.1 hypothetical protein [Rhizobium wenxiniae]
MSAGKKSSKALSSRTFLGLPISTLGWNAALARAEELALSKGNPATLSFLDEATLAGVMLGLGRRDMLKHHLLLPAGGALMRLLLKLVPGHSSDARFSSAGLVSALLTYFAQPRRIGIFGDDMKRLEALRAHFGRHAPWHEFVAISPDANPLGRLDLVIVEGNSGEQVEHRLRGADIGLVIMTGRGLRRLARPQPVSTAGAKPSTSQPSLA